MWNTESTLKLIESFHALPCLWDIQTKEYKNRNKKTDAYTTLAEEFNVTATEIEKKLHALKVQFRREHKRETFSFVLIRHKIIPVLFYLWY